MSSDAKTQINVAIIGAGIGGLALAIGLLRQNIPYTLYESAAAYSMVGAGVGLGPNAQRAMDMLEPKFKALYEGISTGNVTPGKNHVIFDTRLATDGFGEDGGWGQSIESKNYERTSAHRKDLLDIMTSLIPIETVKFNKKATTILQVGTKVIVKFSDGEEISVDAVIGCDGSYHGATRPAVLGERFPEHSSATYAGKYCYRSIVPMKEATEILGPLAGDAQMFLGKGRNVLAYPISKGTELNVIAFVMDENSWTHNAWVKEVSREEMVGDWEGFVDKRLVKLLDWAKPLQWSMWHHLDTPTYYNSHICILGDSAHASTPHQAANAGQALEDAAVLSHVLGLVTNPSELPFAFKAYDGVRRPRAQKVVATSWECGRVYALLGEETGDDREKIVENLKNRWEWIWTHDLAKDVKKSEVEFASATA